MAQIDTTQVASTVAQIASSVSARPRSVSNERVLQALDSVASAKSAALQVVESVEAVEEAVQTINSTFEKADVALRFVMDEVIDRPVVSVVDEATGKVVRQLPSEEVLRTARNIESMRGILINADG